MKIPMIALIAGCAMLSAGKGHADDRLPPHDPGTICRVPGGWCVAPIPGPVQGTCTCSDETGRQIVGHLE